MGLVDHHGLAVEAISVEPLPGLVCIGRSHLDKGETVADYVDRKDSPDHAEERFHSSRLGAVRKVPDQEFLCRGCHSLCILMLRFE